MHKKLILCWEKLLVRYRKVGGGGGCKPCTGTCSLEEPKRTERGQTKKDIISQLGTNYALLGEARGEANRSWSTMNDAEAEG